MDTKTYTIGSGEITLTIQDAEELRILLQMEHLRNTINELIEQRIDCFNFGSDASRNSFVDEIAHMNDDLISYDSSYYEEMLLENIFNEADLQNLTK